MFFFNNWHYLNLLKLLRYSKWHTLNEENKVNIYASSQAVSGVNAFWLNDKIYKCNAMVTCILVTDVTLNQFMIYDAMHSFYSCSKLANCACEVSCLNTG